MPDPKDYNYLYQVGENSYAEPWNMRSLFGNPEPRALTSQEEVTVSAPMPEGNDPYPKNMDEIMLGTRTVPPTGTYTPPLTQTPKVNPILQPAWNDIIKRYPFAQNLTQNVDTKLYPRQTRAGIVPDDSIYGSQSGNSVFINADLPFDKPYQVPRTLTHELTHAAQYKQFPDDKRNDAHYGMRLPYEYRPGEELAREVATQAQSKVDKEILDDAQARMIADWKAGKGPKPWFMYDDVIARRKAREAADK